MVTFLGVNGCELTASDADVVAEILSLAGGDVSEDEFAAWVREFSRKLRR